MQEFDAGRGIIKRRGKFFGRRRISFITEDEKDRPDPFAVAQRKILDAFKKDGVDQMQFIFAPDFF